LTTQISLVKPSKVEDLSGFAGFTTYSLANYTFNDTASKLRTLVSDTKDFCGEKVLNFTMKNKTT
jgi:hypothetical protein